MILANTLSISGLLTPERICVGLDAGTKQDAINEVVDLLSSSPEVRDVEQLRADVFTREQVMSTGVGKGLALPHAQSAAVSNTLVAFAVTKNLVDYNALDGVPVRLILLLVGPENERAIHVRLLGRISRLMNDPSFRALLIDADDEDAIVDIITKAEEVHG